MSRSLFENQSSTWLSHDEYVGVKCRHQNRSGSTGDIGAPFLGIGQTLERLAFLGGQFQCGSCGVAVWISDRAKD
jgi:hypothetical protein